MVVVEVAEKQVRYVGRLDTRFHHSVVGAGSEIEKYDVFRDPYEVSRAHTVERWRRRTGPEQLNLH